MGGFLFPLLLGCGIVLIGKVAWWPGCRVWLWVTCHLLGVGLCYLVGLPVGKCCLLYRADAPLSMFIGEVLSVFRFL